MGNILNYKRTLQPYDFQKYRKINPNLTESVYRQLRMNGSEWKILCGLSIFEPWGEEVLKEFWCLKNGEAYKDTDFYKHRYQPNIYLDLVW